MNIDSATSHRSPLFSTPVSVPSEPEDLAPAEILRRMEKNYAQAVPNQRVRVIGRVADDLQASGWDSLSCSLETNGASVTVRVPEADAKHFIPGTELMVEGLLTLKANAYALEALVLGRVVVAPGEDNLEAEDEGYVPTRELFTLTLTDFLQRHPFGLVILGSQEALHEVDTQLKLADLYPGPLRRELIRQPSREQVLAAVDRYSGIAQGVLLVWGQHEKALFGNDMEFIEALLETRMHIYVGIVPSERRLQLTLCADEVFADPNAAGIALVNALTTEAPLVADAPIARGPIKVQSSRQPAPSQRSRFYPSQAVIWGLAFALFALIFFLGTHRR